ncbi:MAG: hypothetical protein J7L99_07270 [Planctomycetes bacterium]|nr:hypothetical protein [Planctomycetota bacterium]
MPPSAEQSDTLRELSHRNAKAALLAAVSTIVVEGGAYIIYRTFSSAVGEVIPTLLIWLLWVIIATPIFSASGERFIDGLVRGGIIIDTTGVFLIILAIIRQEMTILGAIEIYLIFCSVGLVEILLTWFSSDVRRRFTISAAVILAMVIISASPFWTNGIIQSFHPNQRDKVATIIRAANPVFATVDCPTDGVDFVWNERPILYEYTILGRDIPSRPVPWYMTVAIFAALGVIAGVILSWRAWRETYRPLGG